MSLFSTLGITSSLFDLLQSTTSKTSSSASDLGDGTDFSSSLKLRLAEFQANSLNSITSGALSSSSDTSPFDFLIGQNGATTSATPLPGLSASGRNLSLFDPESAFAMMSRINSLDVTYKAQFSELSEMKTAVSEMEQAGQTLGDAVDSTTENAAITSQLQTFVSNYNEWVSEFEATVQSGGVLAGTQAAEISLYELRQSIENRFNGAMDGFRGTRRPRADHRPDDESCEAGYEQTRRRAGREQGGCGEYGRRIQRKLRQVRRPAHFRR
ncbi:MAG: hypothetical protein QM739_01135 [Propionivibrio sp.]